jgi:hypothetical protein
MLVLLVFSDCLGSGSGLRRCFQSRLGARGRRAIFGTVFRTAGASSAALGRWGLGFGRYALTSFDEAIGFRHIEYWVLRVVGCGLGKKVVRGRAIWHGQRH